MKVNTSVILTVNDKQYTLKFDIKALLTLEQLISTKNITKMMGNPPLSHADTVNCLYVGLMAEQPSVTPKKAMQITENWLKNNTMINLQKIIMNAMVKAGAVGNTGNVEDNEAEDDPGK